MSVTRTDSWTEDHDLLLAETVLRYIREGKTQLEAFEDVAEQIDRTPAACTFRWNSTVRQKYEKAVEIAKKQRLMVKKNANVSDMSNEELQEEIVQMQQQGFLTNKQPYNQQNPQGYPQRDVNNFSQNNYSQPINPYQGYQPNLNHQNYSNKSQSTNDLEDVNQEDISIQDALEVISQFIKDKSQKESDGNSELEKSQRRL